MLYTFAFALLTTALGASINPVTSDPNAFRVPLLSRGYENYAYTQNNSESWQTYANTIAELGPTYVSGLLYFEAVTNVTDDMIQFYELVRNTTRRQSNGTVYFDIEVSLQTNISLGTTFTTNQSVTDRMAYLDNLLHPDGWWFDFWSTAFRDYPGWIQAAVTYAAEHNQSVGGNVFNNFVVNGSDAISFVDDPDPSNTPYGYGFNVTQVRLLQSGLGNMTLLGHMQSNAQNANKANGTFSCHYIQNWNESFRADYLDYWASQQDSIGYKFMYPGFYPLCPGKVTFNPLNQSDGGALLPAIQALIAEYNSNETTGAC